MTYVPAPAPALPTGPQLRRALARWSHDDREWLRRLADTHPEEAKLVAQAAVFLNAKPVEGDE